MANVTIKLTVDTTAILNNPKDPNLGTNCRLSQTGGEEIGNYMYVDPTNSEENISNVTEDDVITWVGIPANGDSTSLIDVILIQKDHGTGGSVLGNPLDASWSYGKTIIRQVLMSSTSGDKEAYTITFNINVAGQTSTYAFDPKITVHSH